jgi:predicted GH43/DUF377 family glycosyl hydrolase
MFDFFGVLKDNQPEKKVEVEKAIPPILDSSTKPLFKRYDKNPIIVPDPAFSWRARATYNPAVIFEDGKVHILYRAQGNDGVSTFGYANSKDGFIIDEHLDYPVYTPREEFEKAKKPGWNSGCEDPRITKIGDRFYVTYTAYDGVSPPRVAMTSIKVIDFLSQNWIWETPKLISPPGVDDKDSCIIKNKTGDGFIAFHRLGDVIWIDFLRDLNFPTRKYLTGGIIAQARKDKWDNVKIGIAAPPIETEKGWLLFYHAVSDPGFKYKMGAMLLDYDNPRTVLARTDSPLLEPEEQYETTGQVANVVFGCGTVVIDGLVYMYYGGADSVVCVATLPLASVLNTLSH